MFQLVRYPSRPDHRGTSSLSRLKTRALIFLCPFLLGLDCSGSPPDPTQTPAASPSPTAPAVSGTPTSTPVTEPAECGAPSSGGEDEDGDQWSSAQGDCNDRDPLVYPGSAERCNDLDDNCNGESDEGLDRIPYHGTRYFVDQDNDGFGAPAKYFCRNTHGLINVRGDCDDSDPCQHPGAEDMEGDGIDQDCGGSDGPQPHVGLNSASMSTIQSALRAAESGHIVWVGPGVYYEHDLKYFGKSITLISTSFAEQTILHAQKRGRVLEFDSNEPSEPVLDGFTITGGAADKGGGILVYTGSPVIEGCMIVGNTAELGGGLYYYVPVRIRGTTYSTNTADYGGGVRGGGNDGYFQSCVFEHNKARSGGGLYWIDGIITIDHALFDGNEAEYPGMDVASGGLGVFMRHGIIASPPPGNTGISIYQYSTTLIAHSGVLGAPDVEADADWDSYIHLSNNIFYAPFEEGEKSTQKQPSEEYAESLYNDYYGPMTVYVPRSDTDLRLPPEFLSYDANGYPTDWHLSLSSPLIDMGDPNELDPDGTRADMGPYGGPDGDKWDLDWDGYPNYFWPGTIHDAPLGFYEEDYDCDDRDPLVFLCLEDGGREKG